MNSRLASKIKKIYTKKRRKNGLNHYKKHILISQYYQYALWSDVFSPTRSGVSRKVQIYNRQTSPLIDWIGLGASSVNVFDGSLWLFHTSKTLWKRKKNWPQKKQFYSGRQGGVKCIRPGEVINNRMRNSR